jgi:hydroxyacylglutathione hydrolase
VDAGYPVQTTEQATPDEITPLDDDTAVLDVRSKSEYEESHIPGARNIHVGHLRRQVDEVPRNHRLLVHCQAGYRSIVASSVLQTLGFENVVNLIGGYDAWERSRAKKTTRPSEAHA